MFINIKRCGIFYKVMITALSSLFFVDSIVFANPDTLAPIVGNPKVYQSMHSMMQERLITHQDHIDEFIKQRANTAKTLSAVPHLEEEFMRYIGDCNANNMLTRLKTTLVYAGGRIQIIFVKSEDEVPVFDGAKVWGHAGAYVTVLALENEKESSEGRRKIISRLFHEIRARSTRAKELFDEKLKTENPATQDEISAFIISAREHFENDNIRLQQQIEQTGRIESQPLAREFANLTFAVHPDVLNRDYMMTVSNNKPKEQDLILLLKNFVRANCEKAEIDTEDSEYEYLYKYFQDESSTAKNLEKVAIIYKKYISFATEINNRLKKDLGIKDVEFIGITFYMYEPDLYGPMRLVRVQGSSHVRLGINLDYMLDEGRNMPGIGAVAHEMGHALSYGWHYSPNYVKSALGSISISTEGEIAADWAAKHILSETEYKDMINDKVQILRDLASSKDFASSELAIAKFWKMGADFENLFSAASDNDLTRRYMRFLNSLRWRKKAATVSMAASSSFKEPVYGDENYWYGKLGISLNDLASLGLIKRQYEYGSAKDSWYLDDAFGQFRRAPTETIKRLIARIQKPERNHDRIVAEHEKISSIVKFMQQHYSDKAVEKLKSLRDFVKIFSLQNSNRQVGLVLERGSTSSFGEAVRILRNKHYPKGMWYKEGNPRNRPLYREMDDFPETTRALLHLAIMILVQKQIYEILPEDATGPIKKWKDDIRKFLTRKEIRPFLEREQFLELAVQVYNAGIPRNVAHQYDRDEMEDSMGTMKELANRQEEAIEKLIKNQEFLELVEMHKDIWKIEDSSNHAFLRHFPHGCINGVLSEIDYYVRISLMVLEGGFKLPDICQPTGTIKLDEYKNPLLLGKNNKKTGSIVSLLDIFGRMGEENKAEIVVQSVDIDLGGDRSAMLLTGPNMGGKTTTARGVGLAILLTQMGFPLPANNPQLGLFKNIYTIFPQPEQLHAGYGYFGMLIKELTDLIKVKKVGPGDLIILDEVPTGTDYYELVAVATVLLEDLIKSGATVVVTGHLKKAIEFVSARTGQEPLMHTVTSENGEIKPDFKLTPGIAKKSYAIELMQRAGFPQTVQDLARSYYEAITGVADPRSIVVDLKSDAQSQGDIDELAKEADVKSVESVLKILYPAEHFALSEETNMPQPTAQDEVIKEIIDLASGNSQPKTQEELAESHRLIEIFISKGIIWLQTVTHNVLYLNRFTQKRMRWDERTPQKVLEDGRKNLEMMEQLLRRIIKNLESLKTDEKVSEILIFLTRQVDGIPKLHKDYLDKDLSKLDKEAAQKLAAKWTESWSSMVSAVRSKLLLIDRYSGIAQSVIKFKLKAPVVTEGQNVFSLKNSRPFFPTEWSDSPFIPDAVPQSFALNPDRPVMVLTGPNSSGKTVLMFNSYMNAILALSGQYVSGDMKISHFNHILTFFGGHDDVSKGESYFLNVLNKYGSIIKNAGPNDVIILDELHGTDYFELAAIQLAVLHYLRALNVTVIFNTHVRDGLKILDEKVGLDIWQTDFKYDEKSANVKSLYTVSPDPNLQAQSFGLVVAKEWLTEGQYERAKAIYKSLVDNNKTKAPPGSIYSIFKYLCDHDVTAADKAISGEALAKSAGGEHEARHEALSFKSIKDDIRGLSVHLRLIEKAAGDETGKDARYYVPEAVKKKSVQILPILEQFRGQNLRPKADLLDRIYEEKIIPILESSVTKNDVVDRDIIKPLSIQADISKYAESISSGTLSDAAAVMLQTDDNSIRDLSDEIKSHFNRYEAGALLNLLHHPSKFREEIVARQGMISALRNITGKEEYTLYESRNALYVLLLNINKLLSDDTRESIALLGNESGYDSEKFMELLGTTQKIVKNESVADISSCLENIEKYKDSIERFVKEFEKINDPLASAMLAIFKNKSNGFKAPVLRDILDALREKRFNEFSEDYSDKMLIILDAASKIGAFIEFARLTKDDDYAKATLDDNMPASYKDGWNFIRTKKGQVRNPSGKDTAIKLLTGSNMSGKSFFLVQNLFIQLVGQSFGFVPAASANLRIYDQIVFIDRASTNSMINLSAFGSEVNKWKAPLEAIGKKAFYLVDEGFSTTSPDDQAKLLTGTSNFFRNNEAHAILAIHNEKFIKAQQQPDVSTYHFETIINEGKSKPVRFMHKLKTGFDDSKALEVAAQLGLQERVIARAGEFISGKTSPLTAVGQKILPKITVYSEEERESLKKKRGSFLPFFPREDVLVQRENSPSILGRPAPLEWKYGMGDSRHRQYLNNDKRHPKFKFDPVFTLFSTDRDFDPWSIHYVDYGIIKNQDMLEGMHRLIMISPSREPQEILERQRMFKAIINDSRIMPVGEDWIVSTMIKRLDAYLEGFTLDLESPLDRFNLYLLLESFKQLSEHMVTEQGSELFLKILEMNLVLNGSSFEKAGIKDDVAKIDAIWKLKKEIEVAHDKIGYRDPTPGKDSPEVIAKFNDLRSRVKHLIGKKDLSSVEHGTEELIRPILIKVFSMATGIKIHKNAPVGLYIEELKDKDRVGNLKAVSALDPENWETIDRMFGEMQPAIDREMQSNMGLFVSRYIRFCQNLKGLLYKGDALAEFIGWLKSYDSIHLHQIANYFEFILRPVVGNVKNGREYLAELGKMKSDLDKAKASGDSNAEYDIKYNRPERRRRLDERQIWAELSKLARIFALAFVIKDNGWHEVAFTDKPELDITNAWSIVKTKKDQVRNSARFDLAEMVRLYSGSNMSGKTFHLKQLIWAILSAQATGFAPCDGMTSPVFDKVLYIDRVKAESDRDISAFGLEAKYWKDFFDFASRPGLTFGAVDEAGSTTSPKYQSALSYAISEEMLGLGNMLAMASHNHDFLDTFHNANKNHVGVYHFKTHEGVDGRIAFDYMLEEGHEPSNAVKVAEKLGLGMVTKLIDQKRDAALPPIISTLPKEEQRLISINTAEIPQKNDIGEKPYKLLKMAQAGLNVPPFFVIATNGSGEIIVTDELRSLFGDLKKPAIVRSAHKSEGAAYSFSGVFDSYKGISVIEPTPTEIISDEHEEYWDQGPRPESLRSAYKLILEGATEGYRVKKYLEAHHITDFNPKEMNAVVMEEIDMDVFGMFITSNQNNPDEVLIHYQLIDKNPEEQQRQGPEDRFLSSRKEMGGVITYNKKTRVLGQNDLDEKTRSALKQFGGVAGQIEKMFGVQQIELGASKGKVYVFQSRDIDLTKPEDVPRLAHYETMAKDLDAIGYGYYHLPVLILDSLDNVKPEFKKSKKYQDLATQFRSSGDNEKALMSALHALDALVDAERERYKKEILELQQKYSEYVLVIKDASDIIWKLSEKGLRRISYDFINKLASNAKVVIRNRNQNAIRHGDWENVELGAITVIPPEASSWGCFTDNFIWRREPNQRVEKIATGDYLNVLSNVDGVFVWSGNPLSSPSPSLRSSATEAAVALNALPQEWHGNDLKVADFLAELSHLLRIENVLDQDKSTFIFSEKVTFDNGLGVLLPKLAKSGMKVAVIATNDRQRALIDELNQDKPKSERIIYADTIADIRTKVHTARYYYFKVNGDPATDLQGVTTFDITEIVKKIIDVLGKVSGIVERESLDLLHEAARKFAEAA